MSDAENKAVFLSYASQDAEAARRICEALRPGGVEVWFDVEGGLEHGDEWDAKIRRQIKECVLFIAVVSSNTQARHEGYFRIEWDLAAERARGIASGVAFILPVVIDDTREADALVPDRFRAVQWTRLPGGVVTPEVQARYVKLWSHRTAALGARASLPAATAEAGRTPALPRRRAPTAAWIGACALLTLGLVSFFALRPKPKAGSGARPSAATTPTAPISEAAKLAEEARKHYWGIFTKEDLVLAEEFGRRATDLDPQLARGWAVRAGASASYLLRGFVSGVAAQQQASDAQSFANRALAIDRNEVEALLALGLVAASQKAKSQAEAFYRHVLALDPNNPNAPRFLAIVLRGTKRVPEAVALMKAAVRRFPRDPLSHFDLALSYAEGWNFAKAWDEFEATQAVHPFPGARVWQAWIAFQWQGDVGRMRRLLESVEVAYRGDEEAVVVDLMCGLLERRLDHVLEATGRTPAVFFDQWDVPKAWFTAQAYELEGKQNLARQQWQAAETVLRERLKAEPQSASVRVTLAATLARLGRGGEARADFEAVEATWREEMDPSRAESLARFYAATGEVAKAVAWLRLAVNQGMGFVALQPHTLRLEPWWDPIRSAPEFQALLDNPPPPPAPVDEPMAAGSTAVIPKADQKSLAVLAFRNLSDAQTGDYFSDGLSEELGNALGRVPGLRVAGSTSAFSFKGKAVTLPDIARQLGVAYLVEGSVQREGSDVRITAKLINGADGLQVWTSGNLKRKVESSLALQEEIAGLIAKELSLKLGVVSAAPANASVNPQAFEFYVQARQAWNLRSPEGLDRAESLLGQSLSIDPNFARAHAALADVWSIRAQDASDGAMFGARNSPSVARVAAQARKAVALDPFSAETHASLGSIAWSLTWDVAQSESELRRAVALNPNYASARQWLGRVLLRTGQGDEALMELKAAAELDPLSHRIHDNYGSALLYAGRTREALAQFDRALALKPDSETALHGKAVLLLAQNRKSEALTLVTRQLPTFSANTYRLIVLAQCGQAAEVERVLRENSEPFVDRWRILLALGRREEALAALDSNAVVSYMIETWFYLPLVDSIRSEPRFQQFLATLGLTEAHARAQAWRAAHPPEKPKTNK